METRVSTKAVHDLIESVHCSSIQTLKMLRAIKLVLPVLNDGYEETAIGLIVKASIDEGLIDDDDTSIELETLTIRSLIRELDYYADKEKVLDAAIQGLAGLRSKHRKLRELQPAVKKAFGNLDARTKALFKIYYEITKADDSAGTDFLNELDMFDEQSLDVLQDDPALAPALEAFDLAHEVNELLL